MGTKELKRMYADSDYYQHLVGQYGDNLTSEQAERVCQQHCITLADLTDNGYLCLKRGNMVSLTSLLLALGY